MYDFNLPGYSEPIVQNRLNREGGGVMIYINEKNEYYREVKECSYVDEYNNILSVEYKLGSKKQIITVCYRSPDTSNKNFYNN